jgi:CHAT domain-containing protein
MSQPIKPGTTACFSLKRSSRVARRLASRLLLLLVSAIFVTTDNPVVWGLPDGQPPAGVKNDGARDPQVAMLEINKPIERELAADETHAYQLTLIAGQYARVLIDQRRIDVAVAAFGPDGKKLFDTDMCRVGETEPLSLIAETDGRYQLELRSSDKTAPKGQYVIELKELRAASEADKRASAAERLVVEGVRLDTEATADSWKQAIEKYRQSIPLWRAAKDGLWEATALYLMANTCIKIGEKQQALEAGNQALALAQAAVQGATEEQRRQSLKVQANTLNILGRVHNELGDRQKALDFFNQALPLRVSAKDLSGQIVTLNDMGEIYYSIGDYQKAADLFNQSLPLAKALGDRKNEGEILNNICVIQDILGEHRKSIDTCKQSLAIRREMNDRLGEATTLNNLGGSYSHIGEYQQTLDAYLQSRAIHKERGDRRGEAIAISNIGWLYDTLGEYEKAADYYNLCIDIFRKNGDQYRYANALNNLAVTYMNRKDFRTALDLALQALALRGDDRSGRAISLNNIAGAYFYLGDKQKALDYYNQSLAIHRTVNETLHFAITLTHLGDLHRELGNFDKAIGYLDESLQLARTTGNRNVEATTLYDRARLECDRGNLAEAKRRIDEALADVEYLRLTVKNYQQRATLLAFFRKYHEFNVDLLMRLHRERPSEGFEVAAFQASETGRARSLLDMLAEARAEIRQGVDPALLERERRLREAISDGADRQTRLIAGKRGQDQIATATKELEALTTEYDQVEAQIREASPRYAALTQPAPLSLTEIQTRLLDNETVLLEYALGDEKSYLWAVTPASIRSFELPKRSVVESAAREAYELLTARNRMVSAETLEQRRKRIEQADAEYLKQAAALSRMLLGPVAAELKGKRLVIVGEGLLHYTPFAALPAPDAPEGVAPAPLIADHEIITLPSASVLGVLRRESGRRQTIDKMVAVFADPVFTPGDPRVGGTAKNQGPSSSTDTSASEVNRSASESGLRDFARLRFSRQEADEVRRLTANGKQFEALDFAANRATATRAEMEKFAIIHFATHGLINNQHPELSGVVLSLVDEQGRAQNGFLRLYDIYNLKLNADLVVLSACQTALGKEVRGEGIIGLTRGFMYAGARRVVASLWQVDDRATAELMKRFYQAMLGGGMKPAAALRSAQTEMWRDKRWQAPYYWGAFTLQGDWQ